MTQEQINKILDDHKLWLESDGSKGQKANFEDANLRGLNFAGADLRGVNFAGADLRYANFSDSDLFEANFCYANLRNSNLSKADLCNANLYRVNFIGAIVEGADFTGAIVEDADFFGANIEGAIGLPKMTHKNEKKIKLLNLITKDFAKYLTFVKAIYEYCNEQKSYEFLNNFKISYIEKKGEIFIDFCDKEDFLCFQISINEIQSIICRFQGTDDWRKNLSYYAYYIEKIREHLKSINKSTENSENPIDKLKNILKSRQEKYGDSEKCLSLISQYWSDLTGKDISQKDVCVMMAMMKLARLKNTKENGYDPDTLLDLAGYALLALEKE